MGDSYFISSTCSLQARAQELVLAKKTTVEDLEEDETIKDTVPSSADNPVSS